MGDNESTESAGSVEQAASEIEVSRSGYLLFTLLSRSLRPYLSTMNAAFLSFFILLLHEFTSQAEYFSWERSGAFLDMAAVITVSAFLFSFLYNAVFIATRTLDILAYHFGRLWVYAAPGFASFLIFVEIPLYTLFSGRDDAVYIIIFTGFLLTTIALLLYFIPVFSGINATMLFMSSVFSRIILFPFEHLAADIFSKNYLVFNAYLLLGVVLFYLLLQIRYKYHLTPYYERFRVPAYAIFSASFLWMVLAACVWFMNYPLYPDIPYFNLTIENQDSIKKIISLYPVNILLLAFTLWIFLSLLINFNYRSRIRKKTLRWNFSLFVLIFTVTFLSGVRLAVSFPGNERLAGLKVDKTLTLQFLSFAGFLLDSDGDFNSLWPGGDPDDTNPCIRADYRCADEEKNSDSPGKYHDEHFENARGIDQLILVTVNGRISDENKFLLRSNSPEKNLHALLYELNGMEEFRGLRSRSFISEMAELGYRTICGGYTGENGYLHAKGIMRFDSGCQIFMTGESLKHYGMNEVSLSSTVNAMGSVYKKYKEKYTFMWIHYDADPDKKTVSEEDLAGLRFIHGSRRVVLVMDSEFGELNFTKYESEEAGQFSLRKLIYTYMDFDPYEKNLVPGPVVIEGSDENPVYAESIYRWRKNNINLFPARTAVSGPDGKLQISDYLTGIVYSAE